MISWEKIEIEIVEGYWNIKNDLAYNVREDLYSSNKTTFFEIFLQHSNAILLGIFYRPPNESQSQRHANLV